MSGGGIADVVREGALQTVFQPIVDLVTGEVVAHEALTRGPDGPLHLPSVLFGEARRAGLLAELDRACLASAIRTAHAQVGASDAPATLFVNVEPEVLDFGSIDELAALTGPDHGLRVVLEITERALSARPAELLHAVEQVHELGWAVALDDVGAESASLAFMPLLRPDVVKLDLELVQRPPSAATAEVMHAVNAHSERTGAWVLGEGIETDGHRTAARALGATLGQGWLFGRPAPGLQPVSDGLDLLGSGRARPPRAGASPFDLLPGSARVLRSPKRLLVELSKQLEREAERIGETCVVAATFQHARHFTPLTRGRYHRLAERTAFVCALGQDLPVQPVPGVRGGDLPAHDPLRGEWDVTVLSPHFATALLARDLGDDGPEMDRMFEYALTYDRDTVVEATRSLLSRVAGLEAATG